MGILENAKHTHTHTHTHTLAFVYCPSHLFDKGKVKCILIQALKPCTARTAHRGSRGIALLFLDHGIRRE